MNRFQLIVLDLLHNMMIRKNDFYAFNYQESLNISDSTSLNERKRVINILLEQGYIHEENHFESNYIGLTSTGGAIWEEAFCVNWDLFYESYFFVIDDEVFDYFIYATNRETLVNVVNHFPSMFQIKDIKTAKNWQPIYWKEEMDGYFIQKTLKEDPPLYKLLPEYRDKNLY